jgi:glycosyltransferase involved in cell wall biosynthesis
VLIVAENASEKFGGEAVLPLRYFRMLRERGVPTWLLTHARVRRELTSLLPQEIDRVYFVEETALHRFLWRLGSSFESRLHYFTTGFLLRLLTQRSQRKTARRLIREHAINVVHQPTPVSPREPSLLMDLGAPVIIGPMNGNMNYPPAFRTEEPALTRMTIGVGRAWANFLNNLFPGKRRASMLLVANERSKRALVSGTTGKILFLPENGVDTSIWRAEPKARDQTSSPCRFVFVGRLIRSKGVDLWLRAYQRALARGSVISALVIGDGPESERLKEQARSAGMLATAIDEPGKVFFAGFQPQGKVAELIAVQDCLVLPTLIESGGAVLLEAMASGLPVIATDWGGPADYVDRECGILVPPDSRESLVEGLTDAMERIAQDPELRRRMGVAGRRKVEESYTWDGKIDRIMTLYRELASNSA